MISNYKCITLGFTIQCGFSQVPLSSNFHDQVSKNLCLKKTKLQSTANNGADGAAAGEDENNDDDRKEETKGLLQLPPIGESSFDPESVGKKQDISGETTLLNGNELTEVAFVGSAKFELQYTCAVCETKNIHKVSRLGKTTTTFS